MRPSQVSLAKKICQIFLLGPFFLGLLSLHHIHSRYPSSLQRCTKIAPCSNLAIWLNSKAINLHLAMGESQKEDQVGQALKWESCTNSQFGKISGHQSSTKFKSILSGNFFHDFSDWRWQFCFCVCPALFSHDPYAPTKGLPRCWAWQSQVHLARSWKHGHTHQRINQ